MHMNFRKINENALTFRILWEIEKLTEADEVFTSSDAQFNKRAEYIRICNLAKKGVLYPDHLVK